MKVLKLRIFVSCLITLLTKDLLFQNKFITLTFMHRISEINVKWPQMREALLEHSQSNFIISITVHVSDI